ncbi:hypothetical protein TanjilG_00601 [Lupinus angustifolius]|uniref:SPARK domain-containing protein n=1 Tax=Lupinus angustifolius TaxID=3871 RepID=A0A1J7FV36_LUPAN|nr:hypothetical protein TanjilG_00601 [Lupinus angustifolius]
MGQGANVGLQQICSIHSSNLTEATCPVKNVNEFHDLVDTSKLLTACENIDLVNECCYQICQSIILEATSAIASKGSDLLDTGVRHILPEHSIRVNDCRNIVLRWVASKLDPSHAKKVLRGLSNCKVNTAYPLLFPDMNNVAKVGGDGISNKSAVVMPWKAIGRLPSDATFDSTSGISFLCDLNDNIPAPWPSTSQVGTSSCKKRVNFPALPAAASSQSCLYNHEVLFFALVAFSFLLMILF